MGFAENLRRICKEKHTSPTKLVMELGLSTSKVNRWYNGSIPKPEVMQMLAEKLGCTVMDFFQDDVNPTMVTVGNGLNNSTTVELNVKDDDEKDILRIFRSLGRRERHDFMANVYKYDVSGREAEAPQKDGSAI